MLHAHMPYVRDDATDDPLEEDWLFEAISETYVPLVAMLGRLSRDGIPCPLTLGITPTLAAMLADPVLIDRYYRYLDRRVEWAARLATDGNEAAVRGLAGFYRDRYASVRATFRDDCRSDLLDVWGGSDRDGAIELIAGAATHGCLPLLATAPVAVRAQVRVGIDAFRRRFGRMPRGFWLPECGYAPEIEPELVAAGVGFTFVEERALAHVPPGAPVVSPAGVVFFARDPDTAHAVWSRRSGYPGDPQYREFHRDLGWDVPDDQLPSWLPRGARRALGLKCRRVTGDVALGDKAFYDREAALARAHAHADDFVAKRRLAALRGPDGDPPLVVSPYDAELFGHWWFEGPEFLEAVFRRLATTPDVEAITPVGYLDRYPECAVARPTASTWGAHGDTRVWLGEGNDWIYPRLDAAAVRFERALERSDARDARTLAAAAREWLLAQASDWPFMMKMGVSAEYAVRRVCDHLERFDRLMACVETGEAAAGDAAVDPGALFPDLEIGTIRGPE